MPEYRCKIKEEEMKTARMNCKNKVELEKRSPADQQLPGDVFEPVKRSEGVFL